MGGVTDAAGKTISLFAARTAEEAAQQEHDEGATVGTGRTGRDREGT